MVFRFRKGVPESALRRAVPRARFPGFGKGFKASNWYFIQNVESYPQHRDSCNPKEVKGYLLLLSCYFPKGPKDPIIRYSGLG